VHKVKENMKDRTEIIIHIIIIVVLVMLIFYVEKSSQKYDCANCVITFNSDRISFTDDFNIYNSPNSITYAELYDYFSRGKCRIIWTKTEGFKKI